MISASGIGTVSWLELTGLIICCGAVVVILRGLMYWAKENRYRRKARINGRVRIMYRGKIRLFSLGLVKASLYLLLCVQAALLPPRPEPIHTGLQRTVAAIGAIAAPAIIIANILLLVVILALEHRDRRLMDAADRKEWGHDIETFTDDL